MNSPICGILKCAFWWRTKLRWNKLHPMVVLPLTWLRLTTNDGWNLEINTPESCCCLQLPTSTLKSKAKGRFVLLKNMMGVRTCLQPKLHQLLATYQNTTEQVKSQPQPLANKSKLIFLQTTHKLNFHEKFQRTDCLFFTCFLTPLGKNFCRKF